MSTGTPLDLDALRGRWAEQGALIHRSLDLDLAAVRAALTRRTRSAFRRHAAWLVLGMGLAALAVFALSAFVLAHWGEPRWMLLGLSLLPLAASELAVDALEWGALRRLDLSAPVAETHRRLDRLQARRLRQVRALVACSVLLWLPLLAVAVKGLFGGDLTRVLHPSVFWINAGIGLAFVPLFLGIAAWVSRRFGPAPGLRRYREDAAGDSWARARGELEAAEDFERLAASDPVAALRSRRLPPTLDQSRRRLRHRLLAGILACAAGLVAIGLFNAGQGGKPQFILPGVLVNLALVAQMAAAIQLRLSLAFRDGIPALRERFAAALALRRRFAAAGVATLPLLLPMLAQVLAQAVAGLDLAAALSGPGTVLVLSAAATGTCLAAMAARRRGETFAPRLVAAMALGVLAPARELLDKLEGTSSPGNPP